MYFWLFSCSPFTLGWRNMGILPYFLRVRSFFADNGLCLKTTFKAKTSQWSVFLAWNPHFTSQTSSQSADVFWQSAAPPAGSCHGNPPRSGAAPTSGNGSRLIKQCQAWGGPFAQGVRIPRRRAALYLPAGVPHAGEGARLAKPRSDEQLISPCVGGTYCYIVTDRMNK